MLEEEAKMAMFPGLCIHTLIKPQPFHLKGGKNHKDEE